MRRAQWLFFAVLATVLLVPGLMGLIVSTACKTAAEKAQRIKRDHLSDRAPDQGAAAMKGNQNG